MTAAAIERRLATTEDEPFLRLLFDSIRRPEFSLAGLPDPLLTTLLDQQFRAQRSHYESAFPEARFEVLWMDDAPIGNLTIAEIDDVRLLDIALLPTFRGHGIGTRLLKDLQIYASEKGKGITLHVEQFNPARSLYERLGFTIQDQNGIHFRMNWQPK